MGRGNGESGCSKIILVVLNAIFLLLGLAVLALGIKTVLSINIFIWKNMKTSFFKIGIYIKVDPSYATIANVFKQNFSGQTGT